ncbi:MAG: RidA family protein [Candidatus Bathyarchaeota archaeon]|nr:RidA family protein [Candidatus Bathyarchaeota archaeon]MDH5733806.1 RidA family protein [Candidatus Bathyarchaeota archaeon]
MKVTPIPLIYAGEVQPYAKAVKAGNFIFVSGFAGLNPATGKMAEGAKEQTKVIMNKIKSALEDAGSTFDKVLTVKIIAKSQEILDLALDAIKEYMPDLESKAVTTYFSHNPSPSGGKVKVEVLAESIK